MSIFIVFVARLLLVLLFLPFSALDKVLNFGQAVAQASQITGKRWLATALIVGGFFTEVVMSAAILTGIADRLAALLMAAYCLVTAVLWKQFWKTADFRLKGASRGRDIFWDFLKNLAVAGGFLLLAVGTQVSDARRFIDHPLSSSHPYTAYAY